MICEKKLKKKRDQVTSCIDFSMKLLVQCMKCELKMKRLVSNRWQSRLRNNAMKRITKYLVLLSILMLSACSLLQKQPTKAEAKAHQEAVEMEDRASMITPMSEKRETLMATGYAVISIQNHRNPAQQRLLAIRASKLDAYRALTEQVYGQQLDANTTVADMTVMSDTFRARVEGVIYGAVLVSITPVGDDTYETTLSLDRRVVEELRSLYVAHLNSRRH
jgi:outer membrane protein FlgP